MAPATQTSEDALILLSNTVSAVNSILDQLEVAFKTPPPTKKIPNDIDAISLAHDATKLIRAHVTKLSLLIINTPFTPTAIVTVLRELIAGPLPSLATAVEICDGHTYSNIVRSELLWRGHQVLSKFKTFLTEVPLDGKVLTKDQKNGTGSTIGNGSLASTGMLWQACDDLLELQNLGIAGIVVKKAELYRDTLKDAIEELKEWEEEESDDDDSDGDESEDANIGDEAGQSVSNTAQDEIDNIFGSPSHIPRDDPDRIRPRLELSLRRLKLMVLMFNAIIKRRYKTLSTLSLAQLSAGNYLTKPVSPISAEPNSDVSIAYRIDTSVGLIQQIPDVADNLANSFYQLDTEQIDLGMDECISVSFRVIKLLGQDWDGKDDKFTSWAQTFETEMEK